MIELVKKQLLAIKEIEIDMFTLEKEDVTKVLEKYNLSLNDLSIRKAKLIYRRTAREMPLKSPKDNTNESKEAAKNVSEKLLNKYVEKYNFELVDLCIPVKFNKKKGKLTGLVLQKKITSK